MPETAVRPQKRAEGLSGGAAKRCYGKCKSFESYIDMTVSSDANDDHMT